MEGLIFGILWCLPKPKAEVIIIIIITSGFVSGEQINY